jgi:hypothetical protein
MRPHLHERRQRALAARVEGLWRSGIITSELLNKARDDDLVFMIDFEGSKYTVALYRRAEMVEWLAPIDPEDRIVVAMTQGQPARDAGQIAAFWFVAFEWEDGRPVVGAHGALRRWRRPQGSA